MNKLQINKKTCLLPASWDDLTAEQLLKVVPMTYFQPDSPRSRREVLRYLIPLSFMGRRQFRKLTPEQWYDLFRVIDFLWLTQPSGKQLHEFEHKGQTYLLPDAQFSYVTGIEYAMIDFYFKQFTNPKKKDNPDLKALDGLLATMCRPQKAGLDTSDPEWNGDPREKYNAAIAGRRAEALADLPLAVKVTALQVAVSGLRTMDKRYKKVFEEPELDKAGNPIEKKGAGNPYIDLLYDLAEKQVFGNWEATCFTPIHTIFAYLKKKKLDHDDRE